MKNQKMTPKQVATRLGISDVTFRRWIHRGWAPAYVRLPSGFYLFESATVEKWIQDMEIEPESEIPGGKEAHGSV